MSAEIDPTARCDDDAMGPDARVGPYAIVEPGARLGARVRLGGHVVVQSGARLGDDVVVEDGTVIGGRVVVEPGARIGPNVAFATTTYRVDDGAGQTRVGREASIGAGATIAPAVDIGERAVVLPGTVVQNPVPRHAVISGNPAAITGYVGLDGPRPLEPLRHVIDPADDDVGVIETAVAGVQVHRLPQVRDLRGSLVAGELERQLPFLPRRYFLVFDVPGTEIRGEHAHFACHQFLVAVAGELHVIADDGRSRQEFVLDDRRTGLYLPPMVWGVQYQYSRDCVLMVLASHEYDASDYIRDYSQYLSEIRQRPEITSAS